MAGSLLFEQGLFAPERVPDPAAAELLSRAADEASRPLRSSRLLYAALTGEDPRVPATLERALAPGVTIRDVVQSIEASAPVGPAPGDFDGRRESFSRSALDALDQFATEIAVAGDSGGATAVERLMACVLTNLDEDERRVLGIIDLERAPQLFREVVELDQEALPPLFDARTGRLRSDEFTEAGWAVLEQAAAQASELGYERLLPPHCLLALLSETEGMGEHLVRLQALPGAGPRRVAEVVAENFRLGDRRATVSLVRDEIGEATVDVLRAAQRDARLWGGAQRDSEQIDSAHVLAGLLARLPARLASTLEGQPLGLDLARMRGQLVDQLRRARSTVRREVAFRLPTNLLPSEDLTYRFRSEGLPPALHVDSYLEAMTRALFRREQRHLLVTGLRGVGKTTLVRELARRAGSGEIKFLERKRFCLVDCATVAPQESKEKLAAALAHVRGRTDVILCVDGLGPVLRTESGGDNKIALRAALRNGDVHLVGVMSNVDFDDLLASDHELLEFLTRINVEEPGADAAVEMLAQDSRAELEDEFGLRIEPGTIRRAVQLSVDYVLNERLPAKAIKILRRAAENIDYERKALAREMDSLDAAHVNDVVAEISGIPIETIAGTAGAVDYERELSRAVIGQEQAVEVVAGELRGIKSGLPEPGKPAAVILFAGLTGTGKTELAKALARFYSSSKLLQTYTMGNFTESHTVSGIVGVPPGYVGHEQGGRLINDLNSDPYCVVLLDEAEKAHPDVWKPFLNLFDEAWIVDQRGVKAFADRAIFILTTNKGDARIARMSQAGEKPEEIVLAVKEELGEARAKDGQRVFPSEFLARLQVVVFEPLTEQAMAEIARMAVARMSKDWLEKRDKRLEVSGTLIRYIAEQGHATDAASGFKEGGRIVRKLVNQLIRNPVLEQQAARPREYEQANVIELQFLAPGAALPREAAPKPKVVVEFRSDPLPSAAVALAEAVDELHRAANSGEGAAAVHQRAAECLARVEVRVKAAGGAAATEDGLGPGLDLLRTAVEDLDSVGRSAHEDALKIVDALAASLHPDPAVHASA